jgi:ribonuclease J
MQNNNKPNEPKRMMPDNNGTGPKASRGAAIRASKRAKEDAQRALNSFLESPLSTKNEQRRANTIDDSPALKITGLGGMDGAGSKNMIVVEYMNDAVIMDCGNDLSVDLPGINYGIADTTYLESIKHKLRGYLITHGHLDHIGGLPHIVPKYPAPIYGSRFTVGMVEKIFDNFGIPMPDGFELKTVAMNETTHERLKVGEFFVELVRVTHSIPGSTCIVLDTPVGRLINTGDFKLDPTPHDHEKSDTERLIELGKEGVLLLMCECTNGELLGHTPSEATIEQSFVDIFEQAPGRVFIGVFSSNMNRIQMIVNAAVHHGRKVAFDGRSMVSTLELAVRLGMMKIPKGQVVSIGSVPAMKDEEVVIVCTGSQGEPNSALQRMADGDHKHIKLKEQDTVILSSTPIPESGNDRLIGDLVDSLMHKGVHVFRHATHDHDGCGPLHVSGHARMDEYIEMMNMTQPKFFLPIYGPYRSKKYLLEAAVRQGIPRKNTLNVDNGEVIRLTKDNMSVTGKVPVGTTLVDQTGMVVSNVVIKDRLMLAEEGLVAVILTVDKKSGQLLTSPDIISRGFIYMKDNEELMNNFRSELRRAVSQRFKRIDLDRFKAELKDYVTHFLYDQTGGSPIVIPVVNVVASAGGKAGASNGNGKPTGNKNQGKESVQPKQLTADEIAKEQEKRFQEMRARLLGQDQRD